MRAQLVPIDGGTPIVLDQPVVVVGRSSNKCHVVLRRRIVSKRHCEFHLSDEQLVVSDLGSHNGTHVNGQRIAKATLSTGDEVAFASLRFRVHIESVNCAEPVENRADRSPIPKSPDVASPEFDGGLAQDGCENWFVRIPGEEWGPMSFQELRGLAEKDELGPFDLVRLGERNQWYPAVTQVPQLFPSGARQIPKPRAPGKPRAPRSIPTRTLEAPAASCASRTEAIGAHREGAGLTADLTAGDTPCESVAASVDKAVRLAREQRYFYWDKGRKEGPVDYDALVSCTSDGRLRPEEMVKIAETERWVPAGQIAGLFPDWNPQATPPLVPHVHAADKDGSGPHSGTEVGSTQAADRETTSREESAPELPAPRAVVSAESWKAFVRSPHLTDRQSVAWKGKAGKVLPQARRAGSQKRLASPFAGIQNDFRDVWNCSKRLVLCHLELVAGAVVLCVIAGVLFSWTRTMERVAYETFTQVYAEAIRKHEDTQNVSEEQWREFVAAARESIAPFIEKLDKEACSEKTWSQDLFWAGEILRDRILVPVANNASYAAKRDFETKMINVARGMGKLQPVHFRNERGDSHSNGSKKASSPEFVGRFE